MKIKISKLEGIILDWAVAQCENGNIFLDDGVLFEQEAAQCEPIPYSPSTNWLQGGPIMFKEKIGTICPAGIPDVWWASKYQPNEETGEVAISADGPTPLIAAMRCYVASKYDKEIEIPEELL